MYDKRQKKCSYYPNPLIDKALEQLRNLLPENSFMYKNQKCIHASTNKYVVFITTADNTSFLIKNFTQILGSGTFE